jgi:mono/diheme cytochrome c family protein
VLSYPLNDAVAVAFDVDGRLLVTGAHAFYRETDPTLPGTLELLYRDDATAFHGLAASGAWAWVGAGPELLGASGEALYLTSGLGAPPDAALGGSQSGDAWLVGGGALQRYTTPVSGDEAVWRMTILPIYARVCSDCHAPAGPSGYPLATYAQWVALKSQVYDRVVVKGDMPQGRTLSDDDKAAIAAWAKPN